MMQASSIAKAAKPKDFERFHGWSGFAGGISILIIRQNPLELNSKLKFSFRTH
jgi:hypothetical protein